MLNNSIPEVIVELRGAALWVTLNRPAAFNALTPASIVALGHAIDQALASTEIRSLVVTGAGKAFCAGADLKSVLAAGAEGTEPEMTSQFLRNVREVFHRLESLPIPTIAAINGIALAGGLELMLCCDIAVASNSSKLGDGHANFGQIPGGGGTCRLPYRIGKSRAKQLMFTGQTIDAIKAEAWGLVDEVCEADNLVSRVDAISAEVAKKSSLVIRRMKTLVDGNHVTAEEQLDTELRVSIEHISSYDRNEGLAAFSEKRSPKYLGR